MTDLEQEALSKQHSHGVWLVGLENGSFAVFIHPQGQLLRIIERTDEMLAALETETEAASQRYFIQSHGRERREKKLSPSSLLSEIGL